MRRVVSSSDVNGLFDLTGKRAVVTGVRRGIGLAIAEMLAAAGADIVGVSAHLEEGTSNAQRSVESLGRSFEGIRADLSDVTQVHALADRLVQQSQPIDILVNNAGSIVRAAAIEHDDEMWMKTMATNLTAPFILTRDIGRLMVERGAGKVIFTASLLSFQGGILVPSYTASKHGVAGLVKAFSNEWASKGVNVNGIAPGYIATDNTEALRGDPQRSQSILDRIPAGRWGEATDIAGAALFLASPASDYVCGTVLPVDGGWLAR
jgi:2-deoxy-D-gluconate 3-dehydrogenase